MGAVILSTFGRALIIAGFYLNRSYIACTFCEQRENENNCCRGTCYLKKQLNIDERKFASTPTRSNRAEDTLQIVDRRSEAGIPVVFSLSGLIPVQHHVPHISHASDIFHPPNSSC